MSNSIIKVSFEITDYYNREDFRMFIKYLLSLDTKYIVYILSSNENIAYINAVGEQLGIPEEYRLIFDSTINTKENLINMYRINIHFDNIQRVVENIDTQTEAYGILVNQEWDKFKVKIKYVSEFEKAVKLIEKERKSEKN